MADVDADLGDWLATSEDIAFGPALDEVAAKIQAAAVSLASAHVQSGDYINSFHIEVDHSSPSGRDRIVYNDDPAALSIEYGHVAKRADGTETRVPGQHILGTAAATV